MTSAQQGLMERTLAQSRTRRSASETTTVAKPVIPFAGRKRLSPEQIQALQDLYEVNTHPSNDERAELARELNLWVSPTLYATSER